MTASSLSTPAPIATTTDGMSVAPDRPNGWFQAMLVFILVVPLIGTFYPPESYFGSWGSENQVEVLPYPITPVLLLIFSIASLGMYLALRQRQRPVHEPMAYLYLLIAFASITMAANPQFAFQRALRLLPLVAFGVLYAQILPVRQMLRLMAIAFLISATLSIAISIALPSVGRSANMVGEYSAAWRGATSHKNSAGYSYALGVIISSFALGTRSVNWRIGLAAIGACLVMVVMANSATALIGMVISLALAGFIEGMRRMPGDMAPVALICVVMFIGAGLFLFAADPDISRLLTGRDATLTGRTDIWDAVRDKISARPIFGYGYAFWGIESPDRSAIWRVVGYTPPHSHNSWLDLRLQLGLPGFLAIAVLAVSGLLRATIKALGRRGPTATLALTILIFVISRSFTEVQFSEPGTAGVFWLVWAATLARRA
ncbi:O-antigen ligase [Sphingomonas sp.]|uniref:O-antigen ligase family protein n=1 Tax=Sphingomonas sp. TaxID=28214 RepID=UPI0031DC33BB